jgi:hypothetical protein
MVVAGKGKKKPKQPYLKPTFGSRLDPPFLFATIDVRTVSEANCFEPWQKRHKRHQQQKLMVRIALTPLLCQPDIYFPCRVTVTRFAPRPLDAHDNLRMSLKYIVDQIADCLIPGLKPGRADDDPRIEWHYAQQISKFYYVKIEIKFTEAKKIIDPHGIIPLP